MTRRVAICLRCPWILEPPVESRRLARHASECHHENTGLTVIYRTQDEIHDYHMPVERSLRVRKEGL